MPEKIKNEHLEEFSIENLVKSGEYIVPIYQRNYAWSEKEINQLIDDIYDYCNANKNNYYYIGTLVVYKKGDAYEVIDGQQRLTTLYILISVLKNKFQKTINSMQFSLKFESREKSQKALQEIFESEISPKDDLTISIMNAYEIIEKRFNKLTNEKILEDFFDYLKEKVQILRVEVPKDTDLNHYFEIMNNRGEQLEKHEILKSRMLNVLKNNKSYTELFNTIWEACANMDSYVQYGFSTAQRTKIFGKSWNEFNHANFDNLVGKEQTDIACENEIDNLLNISNIINGKKVDNPFENKKTADSDTPERFNSVINFPNFLLHVLKLQSNEDIPLDDKRLLETFERKYQTEENVKIFAYNLLKTKFLFDNYIIKREYTSKGDEWSLKQLIINDNKESKNNTAYYKNRFEIEDKNKKALMLLSMFHVSAPTLIYKHWLSASLKYLFEQTQVIQSDNYIDYLENLAKTYMKDRYLSNNSREYHEMIYTNKGESQNSEINFCNLNQGTDVENFIFNYVDYLLWKKNTSNHTNFSFAFRSSVEHYYPQNPMENIEKLEESTLNCFGNLCLVTNSENSRLSNFTPEMKKGFYSKQANQSIKQKIMMKEDVWNKDAIKKHQESMINLLQEDFKIANT